MCMGWILEKSSNDAESLEDILVAGLSNKGLTIATAESCTGGLIAAALVNVSGASNVLNEGYVTYSNEAKQRLVGVRQKTLENYGAVSPQVAMEMAEGAARVSGADVALSSTGVAGPKGGTLEKPVGLVYVGCFVCGKVMAKEYKFTGSRMENRLYTVEKALSLALENIGQVKR